MVRSLRRLVNSGSGAARIRQLSFAARVFRHDRHAVRQHPASALQRRAASSVDTAARDISMTRCGGDGARGPRGPKLLLSPAEDLRCKTRSQLDGAGIRCRGSASVVDWKRKLHRSLQAMPPALNHDARMPRGRRSLVFSMALRGSPARTVDQPLGAFLQSKER